MTSFKYACCLLFILYFASGCSTTTVKDQTGQDIQPDVVISRIDQMSSRPDWLKESEVFKIQNGMVSLFVPRFYLCPGFICACDGSARFGQVLQVWPCPSDRGYGLCV